MDQRSAFTTAGGNAAALVAAGATRPSSLRSGERRDATAICGWPTDAVLVDAVPAKPASAIRMFTEVPNHRTRRLFGASP